MVLAPGSTFGPYRILGRLGEGGMASVYHAFQPTPAREVALKIMSSDLAALPAFQARFRREANVLARLEHPNILPIYETGEIAGQAYICYRYIRGGTLKDLLGTPLSLATVVQVLTPVAEALDFAHQQGVVHRDIKPANILLTEPDSRGRRTPIVADYGVARLLEPGLVPAASPSGERDEPLTQVGVGLGTPAYMAPEQVLGRGLDGRADQYALAITAYQMLTGTVPYAATTPVEVAFMQVNEPLPLPRSRNPQLPAAAEQVLLKALAKEPTDRYASCGDFTAALERAIPSRPLEPPVPASLRQGEPPPGSAASRLTPAPTESGERRMPFDTAEAGGQPTSSGQHPPDGDAPTVAVAVPRAVGSTRGVALAVLGSVAILLLIAGVVVAVSKSKQRADVPLTGLNSSVPGSAGTRAGTVVPTATSAAGRPSAAAPAAGGLTATATQVTARVSATPQMSGGLGVTATSGCSMPADWQVSGTGQGQWCFSAGQFTGHSSTGDSLLVYSRSYTDFSLEATVKTPNREASLAFRIQDAANLYEAIFLPDGLAWEQNGTGGIWLDKRTGYIDQTLAYAHPGPFPTAGGALRLRVVATGPLIEVFANGVRVIAVSDASYRSGTVGLRIYGDTANPCDGSFSDVLLPR
jgi:serine/threonine-protein kinase